MSKALRTAAICTALVLAGGCASGGKLSVRPIANGFAGGDRPASFRVAEARAHFALGNVALAAEGFRRALREDPSSVDALNGLAACYDKMGRFDLARAHYEQALALAPNDPRLYVNLATSLDLQGKAGDAAELRREATARFASASSAVPLPPPAAAPAATPAVPIAAPARSVTVAIAEVAPAPAPAERLTNGPRLERIGLGEVALRSGGAPSWTPLQQAMAALSSRHAEAKKAEARTDQPLRIVVLNGTSRSGLAARARAQLQSSGWSKVVIGHTAEPLRASQILYPAARAREARLLADALGVPLRQRDWPAHRLVVQLGRDQLKERAPA